MKHELGTTERCSTVRERETISVGRRRRRERRCSYKLKSVPLKCHQNSKILILKTYVFSLVILKLYNHLLVYSAEYWVCFVCINIRYKIIYDRTIRSVRYDIVDCGLHFIINFLLLSYNVGGGLIRYSLFENLESTE